MIEVVLINVNLVGIDIHILYPAYLCYTQSEIWVPFEVPSRIWN